MHSEVKSIGRNLAYSVAEESEMSIEEPNDDMASGLSQVEFNIELFEQPRLRM